MWQQIRAILWAQFRTTRNHLPRTNIGSILMWAFSLLWYALFVAAGIFLAINIPSIPRTELQQWIPFGLLLVFLYWQVIPLFTLSSGWSLQLNKLQVYPVSTGSLFGIEVLLRVSSSPEMLVLLGGAAIGLARHAQIPWWAAIMPLFFIPLNLFLQLAIRDFILHSFERNRFREIFAILLISIGVVPQLLLRGGFAPQAKRYAFNVSGLSATPWHELGVLTVGEFSVPRLALFCCWTALAYLFARTMFRRSLRDETSFRAGSAGAEKQVRSSMQIAGWPSGVFRDPLAALLQKEFESLLRMPRFRVLFGMACVFSVVIFVPIALGRSDPGATWLHQNFLPLVNLYGLLLLSDALLLNAFGLDRAAVQTYFVAPVALRTVVWAKNLTAISFVAIQTLAVLLVVTIIRVPITLFSIAAGIAASAVVTVFLLSIGNLTSFNGPRPLDPRQTFKKQGGARMQLWILLCSICIFLLIGFAYLARYAFHRDWVLFAVLICELAFGLIVYHFATESAVQKGMRDREKVVDALSKNASPISRG
jgi:ABC-2 type transport system permease protein